LSLKLQAAKVNSLSKLLILGVCALSLSGCVSRKEIVQFKQDLAELKQRNRILEERSSRLDSLLTAYGEILKTMKAEMSLYSEQQQQQLNNLEARIEDLASLYSQSYSRKPQKEYTPIVTDTFRTDTTSLVQVDPKKLYDAAYLDLTKGNYMLAISGFNQYLQSFPDTPLSDNALYWIGESYYAQAQYDKAVTEFQKILQNYPDGDKVPAALYKIGLAYLELKDKKMGNQFLKRVMDEHPRSPESKLAKDKLK
jgi:tol-pal system protein YbgF